MSICNPLTPDAYKWISRIPLVSPRAFQWVLANTPRGQGEDRGDSLDFVDGPRVANQNANGAILHFGNNRVGNDPPFGKWNHVSIEVDGEIMYDAGLPVLEAPEVQSTGNRSSLLKARITLAMGTSRQRVFDFDIGAGVEFDVAAYYVNKLELLIPDPLVEIPGDDLGPAPQVPQQLATVLTTTIYFTHRYPQGYRQPLTYTVPLTLGGNQNQVAFIPRQPDAIEIEAGRSSVAQAAGDLVVDFLYVPEGFRQAAYDGTPAGQAPTVFYVLDQATAEVGSSRIDRTLIPGNANAFRVRAGTGSNTFVNLIQVLNV